jgi:hypothetical protein
MRTLASRAARPLAARDALEERQIAYCRALAVGASKRAACRESSTSPVP